MKVPLGLVVRGGLVCGIPVNVVSTNSCLRTSGQAGPAGVWAFPILVVISCNVTSVGDFSGTSLERSGVHGGICVGMAGNGDTGLCLGQCPQCSARGRRRRVKQEKTYHREPPPLTTS